MARTVSLLFVLLGSLSAGSLPWRVSVDPTALRIDHAAEGDIPMLRGGPLCTSPGQPALPGIPLGFVLPPGSVLDSVSIRVLAWEPVEDYGRPAMVRIAVPSEPASVRGLLPDPDLPMVSEPVTGSLSGFTVAAFAFLPVRPPAAGSPARLVTSAELVLHYSDAGAPISLPTLTPPQRRAAETALEALTVNPGDAESWYPPAGSEPRDMVSWVVIADESLESVLQPLVDHRAALGESAAFLSLESIEDDYTGWDTPERIRNCLKDLYWNQGLVYALLVGDTGETIRNSSFILTGSIIMNTMTDLYYSDLDGSWDANGNHLYGEYDDGVDYFADIHVGRFPSDDPEEVAVMVSRTLAYETAPPAGEWSRTAVLAGAGIVPGLSMWGSTICLSVWEAFPSEWSDVQWFEDSTGMPSPHPGPLVDPLEDGCAYLEIAAHGDPTLVGWHYPPFDMLSSDQAILLQNGGMAPVVHSLACHTGNTAYDCLAEALMKAPSGGALAVMMNSNSGILFTVGQGPSELMDIFFPQLLFEEQVDVPGMAHSLSRHRLIAVQGLSYQARWVLQELNFFGDPAARFVDGNTGMEGHESGSPPSPVLTVEPNPFLGIGTASWEVPAGSGEVSLVLMDLTGRTIRSWSGLGSAGELAFPASDSRGEPLPAGCYALVLRCGDLSACRLFIAGARIP